jgi:hypothetical protein
MRTMPLGRQPLLDLPVALLQVLADGAGDLALVVLGQRGNDVRVCGTRLNVPPRFAARTTPLSVKPWLETVAVALLTSQTFPPGALFDRLRRGLYPDEYLAATQKIRQIAAAVVYTSAELHRAEAVPRRNTLLDRPATAQIVIVVGPLALCQGADHPTLATGDQTGPLPR